MEYNKELQDSGYIVAKEFTYLDFPEPKGLEYQDIGYLVIEKVAKSHTYKKYRETFPSRTRLFKYIYSNTYKNSITQPKPKDNVGTKLEDTYENRSSEIIEAIMRDIRT